MLEGGIVNIGSCSLGGAANRKKRYEIYPIELIELLLGKEDLQKIKYCNNKLENKHTL